MLSWRDMGEGDPTGMFCWAEGEGLGVGFPIVIREEGLGLLCSQGLYRPLFSFPTSCISSVLNVCLRRGL